ncbi:MAG TPA: DEAD/DEAH box helicase, partial [Corynebacterium urealyticum]|nr:DEAD/DEAH box helicase [Corynebacterium urealyticum]
MDEQSTTPTSGAGSAPSSLGASSVPPSLGAELIEDLRTAMPNSTVTHIRHVPARLSTPADWPQWLLPSLRETLRRGGVVKPWSHQAETAQHAWEGRDVIVATGTASGKSLGYQLPILTALAEDPTATAVYLAPTKALAQDQMQALARLCAATPELADVMVATYDGDTPPEARRAIREQARIIVTNPDMLHASILGNPKRWTRLLKTLRYLVVDECHVYRGVFGAHVAMVLRRLLRLVPGAGSGAGPSVAGAELGTPGPTVIMASATSVDPAAHAHRLTGRAGVAAVTEDGSPAGERTIALWEPGFLEGVEGEHGAPVRRSANSEAAEVMARVIAEGARTLSFVRSRRGAEIVALAAAEELGGMGRAEDAARVAAYRAGYTPEDRRYLEKALDEGELLGVAATNALELGIDVGGLDAVVAAGFPGTIASFRQQAGRAGRRGQGALVVLVGADDPMDTYLIHHPSDLLDREVENTVFDPHNPYVLADHLVCAAAERALSDAEIAAWQGEAVAEHLISRGVLRRRPHGVFADLQAAEQIHGQVAIRGGAAGQVAIVESESGRMLGTVDEARAVSDVHPGAVYVHQGETYLVDDLDLSAGVAWLHQASPEYSTRVKRDTDIQILRTRGTRQLAEGVWLADLNVEVSHTVTGFTKRLPG